MRTTTVSLLLVSMLGVSTAIECWDTDGQFYAMRATNTIKMKTCESAKSCMKEWYKVVSWGDIYYKLSCSNDNAVAEKSTEVGGTKKWTYSCESNYCNSTTHLAPTLATLLLTLSLSLLR